MKFLVTLCLIWSSFPASLIFIMLWIDNDFDYAWNKFEELVGEALK